MSVELKKNIESFSEKVSLDTFSNIEVSLDVLIGEIKTDIGSLMNLSAGDILKSDVKISNKIDLNLNGNKIAEGILVEEDGYFALQIVSVSG
ncbi:FliM/FliN family flagellar motor C-terminal domain-containing protein [Photobacterium sp. CCB-ST2H9]|uniref:FliM/FliN family flagellar motor switch protein n=1 Tax=unclassified Photobacterium TaxID=2628852 RepID=UPI0020036A5B|nr:FliM/FliN family flagellar motor C-terminal domain-containing protein [Photobacterium sp. CCB-ST2H9]UTM58480.1 FliM/FliN family flagellar motor C-terminal domain-containing protein [Photobacterium sp. CCB-ST2H9]